MPEVTYRDIQKALRAVGLTRDSRVMAHAHLPGLGAVRGGAATVAGALAAHAGLVVMPAFTFQCRVWPLVGPPNNGTDYTGHVDENANAEIFTADLPAHPSLGEAAEALRHVPGALRSAHPLYSFTAVGEGAARTLSAQSLAEPLGPVAHLAEAEPEADVVLLGADHTANVAVHYAEARAGRKQFVRWALTATGAVECVGCPGCADGFNAIAPHLRPFTRSARLGAGVVQRLLLRDVVRVAVDLIRRDPTALLCTRPGCPCCLAVRDVLAAMTTPA